MTTVVFLLVLAVFIAVAVAGGLFGADTRPRADGDYRPEWPFYRRGG